MFEKFSVDEEKIQGPPSTIESGFEEPDEAGLALTAHLKVIDDDVDKLEFCTAEAVRGFAMVYRGVKLDSHEAQCPEAEAAIEKEINNMTNKTFDSYDNVQEKHDVTRACPDALFVYSHLLLGVKHTEVTAGGQPPIWKARLVAGGNYLHDASGVKIIEADLYGAPASLEGVRVVVWRATMSPTCDLLQADIHAAYLQARLKGRPTFVELPRRLWPKQWFYSDGTPRFRHPVLRLFRAIYGLRRSGFDWMEHAQRVLQHHGWQPIRDVADSLFVKTTAAGPLVLCCYVDDLLASGPGPELRQAMEELRRH